MGSGELGAYKTIEGAGLCHRCPFCSFGGISEGGLVCLSLEPEQRTVEAAPVSLLSLCAQEDSPVLPQEGGGERPVGGGAGSVRTSGECGPPHLHAHKEI